MIMMIVYIEIYYLLKLVSIVSGEVDKIFGKNGKKKLKMLVKNVDVYTQYVIDDFIIPITLTS